MGISLLSRINHSLASPARRGARGGAVDRSSGPPTPQLQCVYQTADVNIHEPVVPTFMSSLCTSTYCNDEIARPLPWPVGGGGGQGFRTNLKLIISVRTRLTHWLR